MFARLMGNCTIGCVFIDHICILKNLTKNNCTVLLSTLRYLVPTLRYLLHLAVFCMTVQTCLKKKEQYVKKHTMTRTRRSSLDKFRCGVAPLRIETRRYEMTPYVDKFSSGVAPLRIETRRYEMTPCDMIKTVFTV